VSGADEQQRNTGGRRGWWLVGLLALSGTAVGAFAGKSIDPDVSELAPSLAVAGFGLGGLIGLLLLAPVGVWRAWRRRAHRRATRPEPEPESPELWHAADPDDEAAPELSEAPRPTEPERGEEQAQAPAERPEPEIAEEPAAEHPEPEDEPDEPEDPPPPEGGEPGWYEVPAGEGVRRYWDGQAWTGHLWRGREREPTRKGRHRR
jgi:Protein of unknown function (DUF2510)